MPTLRDDWAMPVAPAPGAIAAYYNDSSEIWLYWFDPATGEPTKEDPDILWPFAEERIESVRSLEDLGFRDSEYLPAELDAELEGGDDV